MILAITVDIANSRSVNIGPLHDVQIGDVISVVLAGLIVLVIGMVLRRNATSGVPGRLQLAFETIVTYAENEVRTNMGSEGLFIVPLCIALFLMILLCNWMEMIPTTWPGHYPILPSPTGNINLPLALAVIVIVMVHGTWIQRHGLKGYLAHYFKPYAAMFPLVVLEEITKPLSLTLRLFGNIFAGGIMLQLIAALPALSVLPAPLDIVWKAFDGLFVGPVQAFIFSLLTVIYFSSAVTGEH